MTPKVLRGAVLGAALLTGVACSSAAPVARPTGRSIANPIASRGPGAFPAYAAVVDDHADVYSGPGSGDRVLRLPARNENGAPQTLLIRTQRVVGAVRWYRVLLPVRPNGSAGWVRAADVHIVGLPYRLEVDLTTFRLDVYQGDERIRSIAIGIGTDRTPTPGGTYYIKELLRPPDQDTVYGHYVFGLSGFSNVLTKWPGGGVLGIHGTNDPAGALGKAVSHGCIRMDNHDIEYLASILPLGTPVIVTA